MRYLNMPCVYCGKSFAEGDDVVTCPVCGSPHHRDCWQEHGCCANAQLHTQGFAWKAPQQTKPQTEKPADKTIAEPAQPKPENTVECPFCGARNYANELYCTVCHEPIHQNASADAGDPLQDEEQREKMYADFRTYGGLDPQSSVGEISVKEYSAYVGEKSGSYIRRFMVMHTRGQNISWNWAACLSSAVAMIFGIAFGPVWFFYRKLNKVGALFLCLLLVLGVASAVVYASDPAYWEFTERTQEIYMSHLALVQEPGADYTQIMNDLSLNMSNAAETYWENCNKLTYTWSYVADIVDSFVLPMLAGFFATGFYFKKARKDILSVREQYASSPDYLQRLKLKGGVSVSRAVLAAVACVVIYMLQQYLPLLLLSSGII